METIAVPCRIEEIVKKLELRKDIINTAEKGKIEIHFKGKDITVEVSVIDSN